MRSSTTILLLLMVGLSGCAGSFGGDGGGSDGGAVPTAVDTETHCETDERATPQGVGATSRFTGTTPGENETWSTPVGTTVPGAEPTPMDSSTTTRGGGSPPSAERTPQDEPKVSLFLGGSLGGEGVVSPSRDDRYPTLITGTPFNVTLDIHNHEREEQSYTTVVQLVQFTYEDQDATPTIRDRWRLAQSSVTLADDCVQTAVYQMSLDSVEPGAQGKQEPNYALVYHLYKGDPPATLSSDAAYRSRWIPVNVSEATPQTNDG